VYQQSVDSLAHSVIGNQHGADGGTGAGAFPVNPRGPGPDGPLAVADAVLGHHGVIHQLLRHSWIKRIADTGGGGGVWGEGVRDSLVSRSFRYVAHKTIDASTKINEKQSKRKEKSNLARNSKPPTVV